jgi:class 3 adenylate cyclase/pimeloyl-ACP methyl ester carboxylesterase
VPEIPAVQYTEGADGLIAYQAVGEHPIDLIHIGTWSQTVEGIWDLPSAEHFYRRLASFARVVLVDRRGSGLSDPLHSRYVGGEFAPWIEEGVSDVLTVLDAIGSERAHVLSTWTGSSAAIPLVAGFPQRVAGLILVDPVLRVLEADDYPWGYSAALRKEISDACRASWGEGTLSGITPAWRGAGAIPSFRHDTEARRWLARYERAGMPRGHMAQYWKEWDFDLRPLLPLVQAPTLVMCHEDNFLYDAGAARYAASNIPAATGPVTIESRDLEPWAMQPPALLDEIEHFVTGSTGESVPSIDRVFAVVLYTDVVESTRHAAELGDRRWRELLEVHDNAVAREIETHRGRLVKQTGDGVLAIFDAPGRAIRCAQAINAGVRRLGIEARSGLHAGEVELIGDDIAGIGVHIAARVVGHAGAGEVIVSRTVKDLVAGSGVRFEDRGAQMLKGVPDEWRLFVVAS